MNAQGIRLGVDLMGGERAPDLFFEAILSTLSDLDPSDVLVVFATEEVVARLLKITSDRSISTEQLRFEVCSDVIEMEDAPLTAVRQKKQSSMMCGVRQLRDGLVDGFVSAGNTGALIAGAAIFLPMLQGVERPALLAVLPTRGGFVAVVDVGGNVSCKPHHLAQFAQMGAAYVRSHGVGRTPVVGLLNIGEESTKGTPEARQAYEALQALCQKSESGSSSMAFAGNIEGREVFQGSVDVLVTDGFSGNILLKASEGVALFILNFLHDAFLEDADPRLDSVIHHLHGIVDYDEYPGAIVCGVDRVLIKCHGSSSSRAMQKALLGARRLIQRDWLSSMRQQLSCSGSKGVG